jgi:hypothetical protein
VVGAPEVDVHDITCTSHRRNPNLPRKPWTGDEDRSSDGNKCFSGVCVVGV